MVLLWNEDIMCDKTENITSEEVDRLLKKLYPDMEFEELSPETLKKCKENLEAYLKDKEKRKEDEHLSFEEMILYHNARF